MGWLSRLFQREPKEYPPLKDTIYFRGNRYFPYPPSKWIDMGYKHRSADEIYRTASTHCVRLNYAGETKPITGPIGEVSLLPKPRPADEPAPPVPPTVDSGLTNFLVAEELASLASDTQMPASITGLTPGGGEFGGGGASGSWDPPDSSFTSSSSDSSSSTDTSSSSDSSSSSSSDF